MTPREISQIMNGNAMQVVEYLLPNGVKKNNEWCVGSVHGEPGKSLMININGSRVGVWKDFADDDSGGDLIDLWQEVRGCSFVEAISEIKSFLSIDDEIPYSIKRPRRKFIFPKKPECSLPDSGEIEWFKKRGISKKILDLLKIAQKGDAIIFPYLSPDGKLELIKYRGMKEKKFWSNKDPVPCLFGWQAITDNHKDVVICEGEIDCLSFWENGIPALSIPKGAGGGGKQDWIEYEFDRLERFRDIFICMDSDNAGDIAKKEIISRLGRHRCKIIKLNITGDDYKDPNEILMAGIGLSLFVNMAETEDPEELKSLADFHDEILKDLTCKPEDEPGLNLPWGKVKGLIKLRPSEVSVWAGINSHGKSVLLSHVIVDGVSQGAKWCVASMEMKPSKFGNKLYRQTGWNGDENISDKIKSFVKDNVWIFNSFGTVKADKILEVFDYARRRYGVDNFVIDSLAKCGFDEEDYSGQKGYVDKLAEYALLNNVHINLVVHIRKKDNETTKPGKFDVKGTGAIVDMVSNAFIIWRDKTKEAELEAGITDSIDKPDTLLMCVKQRETGKEPKLGLWFNPHYCQYLDRQSDPPKQYIF